MVPCSPATGAWGETPIGHLARELVDENDGRPFAGYFVVELNSVGLNLGYDCLLEAVESPRCMPELCGSVFTFSKIRLFSPSLAVLPAE
jgi:hypothetical protein